MTPEALPPRKPSSSPRDGLHLREGLVGLERVVTAQRAEDAGDGEGSGEELAQAGHALLGEPAREVEHRAACTVLSAFSRRYFTPKVHSANFVVIDRKPATIIRNVAPGPPVLMATATPAMLPRPTVPDTAVASAWK